MIYSLLARYNHLQANLTAIRDQLHKTCIEEIQSIANLGYEIRVRPYATPAEFGFTVLIYPSNEDIASWVERKVDVLESCVTLFGDDIIFTTTFRPENPTIRICTSDETRKIRYESAAWAAEHMTEEEMQKQMLENKYDPTK